jgi:hypothetical protein
VCTHRIVADAATQARRCNHGPRATPAHCGSGRSAYQSPVDVGKHEGKHEGTAATLRPAREGGAACHTPGSLWPPRLHSSTSLQFPVRTGGTGANWCELVEPIRRPKYASESHYRDIYPTIGINIPIRDFLILKYASEWLRAELPDPLLIRSGSHQRR